MNKAVLSIPIKVLKWTSHVQSLALEKLSFTTMHSDTCLDFMCTFHQKNQVKVCGLSLLQKLF